MPVQDKLIRKLNENPPDNFAELEELMEECGYGVTVTDPSMGMDDEMASEEMPEDMGPKDEGDEEPMDDLMDMMPPGMGAPNPDESPRMKVRRMTIVAAKKALPKDKKREE